MATAHGNVACYAGPNTPPHYAPPLTSLHQSPLRGFKRSHSLTFQGSEEHLVANSFIRTRQLSSGSTYLPTPPLSASSSCSSGSSRSSFSAGPYPSFAAFDWKQSSVGAPLTISPEVIYHTPALECTNHLTSLHQALKTQQELNVAKAPLAVGQHTPIPSKSLDNGSLPATNPHGIMELPKAPDFGELNPTTEGNKPWLQQEYVEGLIGVSMLAIESIWPNQAASTRSKDGTTSPPSPDQVLPLRYFIQETLRRSRSSATVLQLALLYIHKARAKIRERVAHAEAAKEHFTYLAQQRQNRMSAPYPSPPSSPESEEFTSAAAEVLSSSRDPVICGRRMFLAALICASKFLLDRTYSNRAWSRLSGLPVAEINANERAFLDLHNYELHVKQELMLNWMARLKRLQEEQGLASPMTEKPQSRLHRTQSEVVNVLPMQEVHAPYPAERLPVKDMGLTRSASFAPASASSKFPDFTMNPRSTAEVSRPALQHSASIGLSALSRSSSFGRRRSPSLATSPLRRSLSASGKGRTCGSATSSSAISAAHQAYRIPMQAY